MKHTPKITQRTQPPRISCPVSRLRKMKRRKTRNQYVTSVKYQTKIFFLATQKKGKKEKQSRERPAKLGGKRKNATKEWRRKLITPTKKKTREKVWISASCLFYFFFFLPFSLYLSDYVVVHNALGNHCFCGPVGVQWRGSSTMGAPRLRRAGSGTRLFRINGRTF